jgi:hypothetical protein
MMGGMSRRAVRIRLTDVIAHLRADLRDLDEPQLRARQAVLDLALEIECRTERLRKSRSKSRIMALAFPCP